ncbi:hypothetical protein BD410DRAFT_796682 [Rickenella mellea]|uniref:Mucoidy inhibitor A n=1 Tax=Rickenella mellea TaxID=50990 RepID=A0A4Y7PKY7_9AGAM|nr:hypothetical protein BD410DRAFT_796682 [Rickenella mellea]
MTILTATTTVEYDATQHDVESVTVYQKNRAEITRRIKVELKDGQNDIEVKYLPACIDPDSLRVDGIGNAIIFDVIYHSTSPSNTPKHDPALTALHKQHATLTANGNILKHQSEILRKYSLSLTGRDATPDQLTHVLSLYSTNQAKFDADITALEESIKGLDAQIFAANAATNALDEKLRALSTDVTIIVFGQGDGIAELSLTYVVTNASWTPQYDLRATIAATEKESSAVNLHYRASITQSTGEDWNNVGLKLSTASPLQGTNVPTLSPYCIGPWAPPPVPRPYYPPGTVMRSAAPTRARYRSAEPEEEDRSSFGGAPGAPAAALPPPPPLMSVRESASASEGAISTTFLIPGQSSIPTDKIGTASAGTKAHKVSIAEIELGEVQLEWIGVPRDLPSVFLQCKVKNTSKYVLLPGQTNIFMNNNFVAKSTIQHVSPQESFSCSLGTDPSLRITYHPVTKKTRSMGSVLTAKSSTQSFEQRISIKNTRLTSISPLLIKDQVPVSNDARIKVTVMEPKELLQAAAAWKGKKGGVQARWAKGADAGEKVEEATYESSRGVMEWVCEIGPAANVDVTLSWEVNAPEALMWMKV